MRLAHGGPWLQGLDDPNDSGAMEQEKSGGTPTHEPAATRDSRQEKDSQKEIMNTAQAHNEEGEGEK